MRTVSHVAAIIALAGVVAGCSAQSPVAPSAQQSIGTTSRTAATGGSAEIAAQGRGRGAQKDKKAGAQALVETRVATITTAFWYGPPLLPTTFDVVISEGMITFGPLAPTPILLQTEDSIFARPDGANVQIVGNVWSYNGLPGQAQGTIE